MHFEYAELLIALYFIILMDYGLSAVVLGGLDLIVSGLMVLVLVILALMIFMLTLLVSMAPGHYGLSHDGRSSDGLSPLGLSPHGLKYYCLSYIDLSLDGCSHIHRQLIGSHKQVIVIYSHGHLFLPIDISMEIPM